MSKILNKLNSVSKVEFIEQTMEEKVEDIFSYHSPEKDHIPHYEAIRAAAKVFALVLVQNTPSCPDQSAALRKLRECTMTANASIALKGKY